MGLPTGIDTWETASSRIPRVDPSSVSDSQLPSHPLQSACLETPSLGIQDYCHVLAHATNDAIRDLDLATGSLLWPQGLQDLLGYTHSLSTSSVSFWNERIHPEDRSRIEASIQQAIAGNDSRWTGEYRFRHSNNSFVHLLERAAILRAQDGRARRLVGSIMNVTERKQLQDQLCRSQRMEAFGQLAGGVAHDFNNFLTTILGYSDLVLSEMGAKGVVARHIGEIRKAAGRASDLATQLLAFSRKQALEPQVVEVNSLITNLERSLLPLLGENISVACNLHHEKHGGHVRVDPNQITQIILNLAVNARDAMPRGGQLKIETTVVVLSDETSSTFPCREAVHGEYVLISLHDTGQGMTDEVKSHLFEPFFTTKDRGSGLGLATSYGIIHQSGGHIRIESEPGTGTTVQIYLPKVAAPPKPSYRKPSSKKLPNGTETILVLEDDISVRHLSIRVLRTLGYDVIEAATGDDAQRIISERSGRPVDLLLTDVVMPQMSGRHFAKWLRQTSPLTKVVFVSGYLDESDERADKFDDGMFFLPKPFDPEQLAQTIRHVLDS